MKTILLILIITLLNGSSLIASTSEESLYKATDSIKILQKVKSRAVMYLLGEAGKGTFRQKAIHELDQWVRSYLADDIKQLVWDERIALQMNGRISSYTSDLRRMAIAYRSKDSRYYGNVELKDRITAGMENVLKYFNAEFPQPGNWHPWLIVIPNNVGSTALLMEGYLSTDLMERIRTSLRFELTNRLITTGTNAAWESRNHIYLALLDKDMNRLRRSADYVFRTVRYAPDQGVREDYCYMFHGRIPYAGAYGAGFAQTLAEFIYVFDGTPLAIEPVHREIVINLLLEHMRWFLAAGEVDIHIRGRAMENHQGGWDSILEAMLVLAQTEDPRKGELAGTAMGMLMKHKNGLSLTCAGFADRIKASNSYLPQGFRFWPTGEIGVFKQPSFHIGFRQYSSRVQDYEYLMRSDGGEGGKGWNLAYGFTNILREDGKGSWFGSGKILPAIDMEHLPGTTVRIGANPVNPYFEPVADNSTKSTTGFSLNFGKSHFSGGAGWKDGGVAGFILKPVYGDFTAKKSLHFFAGGYWALGSGITSGPGLKDKSVHTTILQWTCSSDKPELVLSDRSVFLSPDSAIQLGKVDMFWMKDENAAVVFHEPSTVNVRLRDKVLTAWLDHGTAPSKAQYAFAVLPDKSLDETLRFAKELPFRPVRCDENVHAVKSLSGQTGGIVFFAPDTCLGIKSSMPAIIYRNGSQDGGVYTLQDPLHKAGQMELTIDKLTGEFTIPDSSVKISQSTSRPSVVEVASLKGRIYRFGYGIYGKAAFGEPRKDLDLSSYNDFRVEAENKEKSTILTVQLPEEAIKNGYKLSLHYIKSQRIHDFTESDIIDRPSPNTVRYLWKRIPVSGPAVFSDYWKLTHGKFKVLMVTKLTEDAKDFEVPEMRETKK